MTIRLAISPKPKDCDHHYVVRFPFGEFPGEPVLIHEDCVRDWLNDSGLKSDILSSLEMGASVEFDLWVKDPQHD